MEKKHRLPREGHSETRCIMCPHQNCRRSASGGKGFSAPSPGSRSQLHPSHIGTGTPSAAMESLKNEELGNKEMTGNPANGSK
jgi:hypothetical protein